MKMKLCLLASLVLLSLAPHLTQSAEDDADCVLGEEGCPESEESSSASSSETVDLIAILTDSDIQDSIKQEEMFVVVFYAPW